MFFHFSFSFKSCTIFHVPICECQMNPSSRLYLFWKNIFPIFGCLVQLIHHSGKWLAFRISHLSFSSKKSRFFFFNKVDCKLNALGMKIGLQTILSISLSNPLSNPLLIKLNWDPNFISLNLSGSSHPSPSLSPCRWLNHHIWWSRWEIGFVGELRWEIGFVSFLRIHLVISWVWFELVCDFLDLNWLL